MKPLSNRRLYSWLLIFAVHSVCHSSSLHSSSALNTPSGTLNEFNKLMDGGNYHQAKSLCTGQALQLFDMMIMAQEKLSPFLDTAASSETIIRERISDNLAFLLIHSKGVFKQMFMGMDTLNSWMVVHFITRDKQWKISEFEEFSGPDDSISFKAHPAASPNAAASPDAAASNVFPFPVSLLAPTSNTIITRMRLQVRFKAGGGKVSILNHPPFQLASQVDDSGWVNLEINQIPLPAKSAFYYPPPSGYTSGSSHIDLNDTLLINTARSLFEGSSREDAALAVYNWVSQKMQFSYGAVLFGSSSQILRNMKGDCSEAAILTTALLRAGGISARPVLGLIHTERGIFIGHAWTELWLGGWVTMDAAMKQYPGGAQRIKLANLDNNGDLRIKATNIMLQVLSNMEVNITEAWSRGKKLELKSFKDSKARSIEYIEKIFHLTR